MPKTIAATALRELMRSDALFALIDVREWGEFSLAQILGARNIARGSLEKYVCSSRIRRIGHRPRHG